MTELQLTNSEPVLTDEQWKQRFIDRMLRVGPEVGTRATEADDQADRAYAKQAAESYVKDRADYGSPEEAADTDISYWEE